MHELDGEILPVVPFVSAGSQIELVGIPLSGEFAVPVTDSRLEEVRFTYHYHIEFRRILGLHLHILIKFPVSLCSLQPVPNTMLELKKTIRIVLNQDKKNLS